MLFNVASLATLVILLILIKKKNPKYKNIFTSLFLYMDGSFPPACFFNLCM